MSGKELNEYEITCLLKIIYRAHKECRTYLHFKKYHRCREILIKKIKGHSNLSNLLVKLIWYDVQDFLAKNDYFLRIHVSTVFISVMKYVENKSNNLKMLYDYVVENEKSFLSSALTSPPITKTEKQKETLLKAYNLLKK